jgi:hypothetical protein
MTASPHVDTSRGVLKRLRLTGLKNDKGELVVTVSNA